MSDRALYLLEPMNPGPAWAPFAGVRPVAELRAGIWRIRERWEDWWPDVPLAIRPSPYRSIVGPLLDYLDETDQEHNDGQLATVVLPEFVPAKWWHAFLHNQTTWLLRAALLYRRRRHGFQRTIIDVAYHLRR